MFVVVEFVVCIEDEWLFGYECGFVVFEFVDVDFWVLEVGYDCDFVVNFVGGFVYYFGVLVVIVGCVV